MSFMHINQIQRAIDDSSQINRANGERGRYIILNVAIFIESYHGSSSTRIVCIDRSSCVEFEIEYNTDVPSILCKWQTDGGICRPQSKKTFRSIRVAEFNRSNKNRNKKLFCWLMFYMFKWHLALFFIWHLLFFSTGSMRKNQLLLPRTKKAN